MLNKTLSALIFSSAIITASADTQAVLVLSRDLDTEATNEHFNTAEYQDICLVQIPHTTTPEEDLTIQKLSKSTGILISNSDEESQWVLTCSHGLEVGYEFFAFFIDDRLAEPEMVNVFFGNTRYEVAEIISDFESSEESMNSFTALLEKSLSIMKKTEKSTGSHL